MVPRGAKEKIAEKAVERELLFVLGGECGFWGLNAAAKKK